MVVVSAASATAGTTRGATPLRRAPAPSEQRRDSVDQKVDPLDSERLGNHVNIHAVDINSRRPSVQLLVSRTSSRWFLDVLSQRLSESQSKPMKPQHWLVDSWWFNALISVIVVANTLQIGLAVDIREVPWNIVDIVFAVLFGLEMVVKIVAKRVEYFRDRWNLLDFALAWMAIVEVIILLISQGNSSMAGKLTILRILRICRLLRMLRLFHTFKELVILLLVMIESVKTLFWLLILVALLVYVTAIFCVELIGSDSSFPSYSSDADDLVASSEGFNNFQYFGTMFRSMFSLFSLITLSEWSTITRPVAERHPGFLIVLTIFAMLTAYGVMNVLVGVMVEQALRANADFAALVSAEHKQDQMEIIKTCASKLANHADEITGTADLTPETLRHAINNNTSLADMLTQIDLPSNCSVRELFSLIDDNGNGRISQDEFEATMYRLLFCGEFQRTCVLQMSLNTMKRMLVSVKASLEDMRIRDGDRSSFAPSHEWIQQEDGNRGVHASMQEQDPRGDITTPLACADELMKLRMELQETRLELGARLAEIGPRWQSPQATKLRTAPTMPRMGLDPEILRMGSGEAHMDVADVNNAAMPAVVPGLRRRPVPGIPGTAHASKAARLLRQLGDLVDSLEQHCCEPTLVACPTETPNETDGNALLRLGCAHLISRLANTLAGGRNTSNGISDEAQSLEERKDQSDMALNTWDTPEGGTPVQSVWAMNHCCGDRRKIPPVKKL